MHVSSTQRLYKMGLAETNYIFFDFTHRKCANKINDTDHPLGIHQFALLNENSREKTHSFVNLIKHFWKIYFL